MSLVGKKAPSFSATAVVDGKEIVSDFSLNQYLGEKEVVFFFYPKDFTSVCHTEVFALQEQLHEFEQRGVAVVGASTDTEDTHLAWLASNKDEGSADITYPLVSDASKSIAANYGILAGDWDYDEEGMMSFEGIPVAYRATFLIDKQGVVRHETVNDLPLGRSIDEMIRLVDALQHVEKYGEACPVNWKKAQ